MKKIILLSCHFIFFVCHVFPLGVDVDELKSSADSRITFINYEGELPQYEAEEIREWGGKIARDLDEGKNTGVYGSFFSIVHVVDPAEKGKFDADIFSISRSGGVRHIDTLRLILQGFFERHYGYTRKDSQTLAFFVTIYNAVHRGDVSYLSTKYKQKVMGYLNENNAGLATNYVEWPGATKILIPLSEFAKKGDISSLDTKELTEKETIDAVREKEDKGIKEREEMIDLQDRQIVEDEKRVEEDKTKIEEDKTKIEEDKAKLEEDKKKVTDIKDDEERAKEEERITKEEERITKEEERITKEEERIIKEDEKIEEKKDKVSEDKEELEKDKIKEEIKKDPDKFVDTYFEEKKEEDERIYRGKFYYLKVKEWLTGGHYNNEMYIFDAPTGETVAKSPNNFICGREYNVWANGVVVISHKGSHQEGHYLTLLNLETLEMTTRGTNDIFWRSFVEIKGNYIYAITVEGGKYYLGKFDSKCALVARSADEVDPNTFFTFYDDRIYVNSVDKKILAIKTSDLTTIGTISP
ncbi:MAG: hypothetical protein JW881_19380 [Spirochaetales bacterium]|nr:hypothetical protein [Spirochaetales bacterium]